MLAGTCLCLREYAGVACVSLYLLGSLVFVRSLIEYAGVCLNFPGSGQVGSVRMRAARGRLDEGQSGSTTLMRPGRFGPDIPTKTKVPNIHEKISPSLSEKSYS